MDDWIMETDLDYEIQLTHLTCNRTYNCDTPLYVDSVLRLINRHDCEAG